MKAKDVMEKLNITRPTLCTYVQKEYIKATKLPTGQYDYDADSIEAFLNNETAKVVELIPMADEINDNSNNTNIQDLKLEKLLEMSKVTTALLKWMTSVRMMGPELYNKLIKLQAEYQELDNK